MRKTPLEQIERVACMCRSNKEASYALGITVQAFIRLCRQHKIEPRYKRQLRSRRSFANAAG
jgi:hypothetical protein